MTKENKTAKFFLLMKAEQFDKCVDFMDINNVAAKENILTFPSLASVTDSGNIIITREAIADHEWRGLIRMMYFCLNESQIRREDYRMITSEADSGDTFVQGKLEDPQFQVKTVIDLKQDSFITIPANDEEKVVHVDEDYLTNFLREFSQKSVEKAESGKSKDSTRFVYGTFEDEMGTTMSVVGFDNPEYPDDILLIGNDHGDSVDYFVVDAKNANKLRKALKIALNSMYGKN